MSADLPRWKLGIEEASALGLRREPKSRTIELLALGDSSRVVVGLRPDATGRLAGGEPANAHPVEGLPDELRHGDAQWEGVAGDATGRIFILRERRSELLVVSPGFRFERRIALRHEWRDDARNGLEGLLLLRRGHVLAAKQKGPVRLIEFGPPGDTPLGLTTESWLQLDEPAMLTSHRELHQLAEWKFADPKPPSLNDLAVHAGRLYVISSDGRCILRVRLPIEPDVERIRLDGRWPLPKGIGSGSDAKAEGLLVDDRLGVLVCVDAHSTGHSLYQVRRSVADLIR